MDDRAFDALTKAVTETWPSRRTVLGRLGLGALAAFGVGSGVSFEEAAAKKSCKKRCKKKNTAKQRRKCRKKCKKTSPPAADAGFPITVNTTLLGTACTPLGGECGTGTGLECVALVCVPIDLGDVCVTGEDCSTGRCTSGICSDCDTLDICGTAGSQQCCVTDATCVANACVLPS